MLARKHSLDRRRRMSPLNIWCVFLHSFSPCVARALDRSLRVGFVCLFSLFPFVLNGVWQPVSSLQKKGLSGRKGEKGENILCK